ncbi:MAG: response regulator [Alphaproteobacteria bacterium]|nr:response regulator [Alphaproteobacteria bacterium]
MQNVLQDVSVLIADGSSSILSMSRFILGGFGISKITTVMSSHHVLDEITINPIDLVIMDWNMEPMNGIELTKFIRLSEESPNRYLPIIIMSDNTSPSWVFEARDAGVSEFLVKPLTMRSIRQRIDAALISPRSFVRSATYFGPDRRRRNNPKYDGPERRIQMEDAFID